MCEGIVADLGSVLKHGKLNRENNSIRRGAASLVNNVSLSSITIQTLLMSSVERMQKIEK